MLTIYAVDSLADNVADDGLITLREAIEAANTNAVVFDAPAGSDVDTDVITFAAELFDDAGNPAPGTITLDGQQLEITDDLTLQGPGAELLGIDADSRNRVFSVQSNVEVSMSGFTITGGLAYGNGGGILNLGKLTISDLTVTDNTSRSSGAGIYNDTGILTIVDSAITHNSAGEYGYGGGIGSDQGGRISIAETEITNNTADWGGGIYASNDLLLSIDDSTIADNYARTDGGGLTAGGEFSLTNSTVSGNTTMGRGGGIFSSSNSSISNTIIYGNSAEEGGGLYIWGLTTSLANTIIVGNEAKLGGGIFTFRYLDACAYATNSTITANTASQSAGGVHNINNSFIANNSIIALNEAPSAADIGSLIDEQPGHNLIARDPLFMRKPSHGGDGWGDDPDTSEVDESANDDYGDLRLWDRSPCINAGSNELAVDTNGYPLTTDFFGDPRIQEETVDIGAIEGGLPNENYFVVNSLDDNTTVDGLITLREALEAAATNLPVGDAPAGASNGSDVITFDPSLFNDGSRTTPQTITLSGMRLDMDGFVDVIGPGADLLIIDAGGLSQVFYNSEDGNSTISGLTITGGAATTSISPYGNVGGGIANFGNLSVSDVTITDNSADSNGGGIYSFAYGSLTVSNSTISDNSAGGGGGGIFSFGTIVVSDSTIEGNSAANDGGGIWGAQVISVSNSTITSNLTGGNGGGIYSLQYLGVSGSTILDNSADESGGGIYCLQDLDVFGSTITGNSAGADGGGVYNIDNIRVSDTTVSCNTAIGSGGGIYTSRNTTPPDRFTNISNCTISSNTAGTEGGGIFTKDTLNVSDSSISANRAVNGGGIFSDIMLMVLHSTIRGNSATENGGGIYTDYRLFLTNSILVGNTAAVGGGIHDGNVLNDSYRRTVITNSTIVCNSAVEHGGISTSTYIGLRNSILAINEGGDFPVDKAYVRDDGCIISLDPWFVDNPSHGGDGWGDDPTTTNIDEAANDDYGDLHLRLGSPAIDRGDDSLVPADLLTDWDGNPRVYGDSVDAGAYEYQTTPQPGREEPSLTVDTTDDIFDLYDGVISLREAIYYSGTTDLGIDIEFDPLVFDPATPDYTITLDGSALYVGNPLTIDATGLGLTIDGSGRSRVFYIHSDNVELIALRITGGAADNGGGIYSSGTLSLVNSVVVGNTATAYGGGIFNNGRWVWTANSTITGNVAHEGGGICFLSGEVNIRNTIVALNEADVSPNLAGELNYYSENNLIGDDPLFVSNPSHGGDGWGDNPVTPSIDESANDDHGDLHLQYSDNTVNAGANNLAIDYSGNPLTTDFDGNPRIVCETVDIGAFEYDGILAFSDSYEGLTAGEEHVLSPLTNDHYPGAASASIEIIQEPSWGTVVANADGTVSYQTYYNFGMEDIFSYRMYIDGNAYNTVTVTVSSTGPGPIPVSTTEDIVDNVWAPGYLSLREALEISNEIPGKATIIFDSGLNGSQIMLDGQSLIIADDLDIQGPGAGLLTIDANQSSRVMEVLEGVELSLYGLTISGGHVDDGDGGAIHNSGILHIESSAITHNSASGKGGGINSIEGSSLSITDSTVHDNSSGQWGGGIYKSGDLIVANSIIDGNTASLHGGGVYILGGVSTMSNSTVSSNKSEETDESYGGGIYVDGTLNVDDCIIRNNLSYEDGGGIFATNGSLTISHSTIQANSTEFYGGGLYGQESTIIVSNSKFFDNVARFGGGGIDSRSSTSLTLFNSLIVRNRAGGGGAMYISSDSTIINSTIIANTCMSDDQPIIPSGQFTLQNSIVGGSQEIILLDSMLDENSGNNLIGVDPFFVRNPSDTGDDFGDLRLLPHSPAVNLGNNSFVTSPIDLDDNPRIHGAAVDAGAYEFQGDLPGPRETPSLVVNTTEDGFDLYDNQIALREAIWYAKEFDLGTDIEFDPVVFDPSTSPHTITLTGAHLYVNCDVSINASDIGGLTIDGNYHSRAFVVAVGSVALEEIAITHGFARTSGTAIFNNGIMLINNCTIADNTSDFYSSAIYNTDNMELVDSTITDNSSYQEGHGIYNANGASLLVKNCTVTKNSKCGIANMNGTITVVDSIISDNIGTGILDRGTSFLTNLIIKRNYRGVFCSSRATSTLTNMVIRNNHAQIGGGILSYGILDITNSTVADNISYSEGGGIYIKEGSVAISSSIISGNSTIGDDCNGGGIFLEYGSLAISNSAIIGNSATDDGGGIHTYDGILNISNSTITGNSAKTNGGGIDNRRCTVAISNSVLSLNSARYDLNFDGFLHEDNNNLIDGDPMFIRNPSDGGDGWGDDPETTDIDESANDDYGDLRLRYNSPAVNMGSNDLAVDADGNPLETDIIGNLRIAYEFVDIGAYEYPGFPGDANRDGTVNNADAAIMSANWLKQSGATWAEGDFNSDGRVDEIDSTLMAANWQRTVSPPDTSASVAIEQSPVLYDLNNNGIVDLGDLAFFASVYREKPGITTNSPNAYAADFDGSGTVDLGDLALFAANYRLDQPHDPIVSSAAPQTALTAAETPTLLPGDANLDGIVNDDDAGILAANWHKKTATTWSQGDFNVDGKITDADVAILAQHWMMTVNDLDDDDDERDAVFAEVGIVDDTLGLLD